jgi:hypothetical protein
VLIWDLDLAALELARRPFTRPAGFTLKYDGFRIFMMHAAAT